MTVSLLAQPLNKQPTGCDAQRAVGGIVRERYVGVNACRGNCLGRRFVQGMSRKVSGKKCPGVVRGNFLGEICEGECLGPG